MCEATRWPMCEETYWYYSSRPDVKALKSGQAQARPADCTVRCPRNLRTSAQQGDSPARPRFNFQTVGARREGHRHGAEMFSIDIFRSHRFDNLAARRDSGSTMRACIDLTLSDNEEERPRLTKRRRVEQSVEPWDSNEVVLVEPGRRQAPQPAAKDLDDSEEIQITGDMGAVR